MAKRLVDVRQVGDRFWFSLKKSAALTGIKKTELMRRGDAGELMTDPDLPEAYWFDREEIWALKLERDARLDDQKVKAAASRARPKTAKQLERQWAKLSEDIGARPRGGGASTHHEKILLAGIAQKKPGASKD